MATNDIKGIADSVLGACARRLGRDNLVAFEKEEQQLIKITELTKNFGSFTALDKISLEFEEGSIYGLVGSNGSGKSTLLRVIAGVYYPDGGELEIDGLSSWDEPETKGKIFFLADQPHFFKNANLKEMSAFYDGLYASFSRERFERLSSIFPISLTDKIENMSKGMQRQAALILALSTNPKFLLLDEAFDGLDPVMRNVLKSLLIDGIENTGMTAIISSHNLRELEDLCDHLTLIHKGHIVVSDALEAVRGKTHKIQAAFKTVPPEIKWNGLNIMKAEKTGSLIQMVVKGDIDEIMAHINSLEPIFCEVIEPSLEELFIYEMEVEGYDIGNILK